ncbi:hypothetical protein D3C73_1366630 [compost metagenome]
MVAAFALREVTIHDGDRRAIGISERAPDETALGVFFVCGKAFEQAQRRLAREQGDAVVAFLAMEMHVITKGLDLGQRKLIVADLGFLQADHVWLMLFDQRRQLMGPGAQAIDVERDDLHGKHNPDKTKDPSRHRRLRPAWRTTA